MRLLRSRLPGVLAGAALLGLSLAEAARGASFQVSPTRFEFSLERRFTNFFAVTNNSADELRLRITTAYLDPGEQGQLRERSGQPYDLSAWIVLNPRRLNLGPSEKRVVRFSVRPPPGLAPGEYRAVVFFEELPGRPEEPTQQGAGLHIQILTRLGVTIYGRIGEPTAELRLESPQAALAPDGVHFKATVLNAGTAHATLDVAARLVGLDDQEQGRAEQRLVVQRGWQRVFTIKLARPPAGKYLLKAQGRVGDQTLFETELPVTVGPPGQ